MKPHRAGLLLALIGALLPSALPAHEPAEKPPWQRRLSEEDERRAAQLEQRLAQLQEAGKLEDALKAAEALAELRSKTQGKEHWQTVNARWAVAAIRRVLEQSKERQLAYARVFALERQAQQLQGQGRPARAEPLLQKALDIRRAVLGEEHPDTAAAYNNLATSRKAQGKYGAADEGFHKALAICRKVLGEEHPDTAAACNNWAGNQEARGRYREAEEGYRRALAILLEVEGGEHLDTAAAYNNLGLNQKIQGKYAQAERNLRQALAIRRKRLGEDHSDVAGSLVNVASNQQAQGKYREAEEGFRKALAIFRKAHGEEHPLTATGYNNLAHNQNAQGKYVQAEEGYRKALAIRRKVLGEEHPDTASSYSNLAANLTDQGRHRQAEQGLRQALAIHREVFGEEHPDTARSYSNLGSNLNAQGRYTEAEQAFRKGMDVQRKMLRGDHPDAATAYSNLGSNLNAQARYGEAEESFRTALALYRKVLGDEHPVTLQASSNLAASLGEQGKYAQAEAGLRQTLGLYGKTLGKEHPRTAAAYNNLAVNQQAQGKYVQAEEGFRKALAIRRKVLGEEHPETALSYSSLASVLQSQGKYRQAEEGYGKALDVFRKALGEDHPDTADSYNNLGSNLNDQGKYVAAEQEFRKALAIYLRTLGEEHPHTALAYNNLAHSQSAQGKHAQAEQGYRRARAIQRKRLGEEHPTTVLASSNVAASLQAQGKYSQAEEGFRQALEQQRKLLGEKHPSTATGYHNLALTQYDQGKYAEAEKAWQKAAAAFASARLQLAATGLERAAKTSELSPLPWLAAVLARNDKPREAWQRFEEGLARGTWDDLAARLLRPAAEQARQAQRIARIDRLHRLLEKTSAAAQSDLEQARRREQLLSQLLAAQDELGDLSRQLEKTYGAAGQVSSCERIQAVLPTDSAVIGWLDLPGEAKAADPSGEHWAVLLRSSGDPVWVRLSGSGDRAAWTDEDTRLPQQLRAALQSPAGKWQAPAERLRRQRLQPLAKHLQGLRRLIVLPSTALAGVPVEVMADGYTISYAPSGSMAAHLLRQSAARGRGLLTLADPVFDSPTEKDRARPALGGDEGKWNRLPGTRIEAAALQSLFGTDEPTHLLLGSEASEQRLEELARSGELGGYRYVHLATHGEVDNVFPLRSAVILARDGLPDEKKREELLLTGQPIPDGWLTAEEVLRQWHLDSELVTLSACQTALGKYEKGEGFVGFAQALILAGSRSVCLSLWKVDDAATALLMQRFYQNLLGKRDGLEAPMARAQALAEAKSWLRQLSREEAVNRAAQLSKGVDRGKGRKVQPLLPEVPASRDQQERPYAHPYYWAAFVLIGQPD